MNKKTNFKKLIPIILVCILIFAILLFNSKEDDITKTNSGDNLSHIPTFTMHKGTITYNGNTKEVEVIDHQINYFNLVDLFPDFNKNVLHNLKCKGTLGTIREQENTYSKGDNLNNLSGDILYIYASGVNAITEHKIADNFSIDITEFISANSVNWENYIKILDTANKSTVASIDLLTFNAEVNNVSDEDLIGKITNVYLNDKPIASNFILDSTYTVWSRKKSNVKYPASHQALNSAKQKNIYKIGLEVQLEDTTGNEIYRGTTWLNLE